jgi:hypothetical protein
MLLEDMSNSRHFITREEYNEYGADYIIEHCCSNHIIHRQGSLTDVDISNKKIKYN